MHSQERKDGKRSKGEGGRGWVENGEEKRRGDKRRRGEKSTEEERGEDCVSSMKPVRSEKLGELATS